MHNNQKFYINGQWVDPVVAKSLAVINPATEQPITTISLGGDADVNKAVAAAKAALPSYRLTTREQRIALLEAILVEYDKRSEDIAQAISQELGAPIALATDAHALSGRVHFEASLAALKDYDFVEQKSGYQLRHEAIGVCGLITPWNWPINQIVCKVAPALAAGCTMVLKPSEITPINAVILAEVLAAAGVPKGVFNMIHGAGPTVGAALSAHPDVSLVSFTGSTGAGIAVAKAAAPTVKRVAQELGGKSANVILDDADIEEAVTRGVQSLLVNSGQTCIAGTRMLVPRQYYARALSAATIAAQSVIVGDPLAPSTTMGPVVSQLQFEKIQRLIQVGIDEGATLLVGGTGKPDNCDEGYFVKPTIFSDVNNAMQIAQEEIFGPVLCLLPYDTEAEAIQIANDSIYGLAAYIESGSKERALVVAAQIEAGVVFINEAPFVTEAPFGGFKQSGNGRESGVYGMEEFLEVKSVFV